MNYFYIGNDVPLTDTSANKELLSRKEVTVNTPNLAQYEKLMGGIVGQYLAVSSHIKEVESYCLEFTCSFTICLHPIPPPPLYSTPATVTAGERQSGGDKKYIF